MYKIIWKNEVVDSFNTLREAQSMLLEYNMAYRGGCFIRIVKDEHYAYV